MLLNMDGCASGHTKSIILKPVNCDFSLSLSKQCCVSLGTAGVIPHFFGLKHAELLRSKASQLAGLVSTPLSDSGAGPRSLRKRRWPLRPACQTPFISVWSQQTGRERYVHIGALRSLWSPDVEAKPGYCVCSVSTNNPVWSETTGTTHTGHFFLSLNVDQPTWFGLQMNLWTMLWIIL